MVNIYATVWVRLTLAGINHYRQYLEEKKRVSPSQFDQVTAARRSDGGYWEFELRELYHVFGDLLGYGQTRMIEDDEIVTYPPLGSRYHLQTRQPQPLERLKHKLLRR